MVVLNYSAKRQQQPGQALDGTSPLLRSTVLRFQRPRLLMAMDFLLALGEFFVPSLGALTGKDTDRDVREDPMARQGCIVIAAPALGLGPPVLGGTPLCGGLLAASCHSHADRESGAALSPLRQLLAGTAYAGKGRELVYDGGREAGVLCDRQCARGGGEKEEEGGKGRRGLGLLKGTCPTARGLLRCWWCLGAEWHLRFKNVTIEVRRVDSTVQYSTVLHCTAQCCAALNTPPCFVCTEHRIT